MGSREQTGISPRPCRKQRQMTEHSYCHGQATCNSRHKYLESAACKSISVIVDKKLFDD